MCKPKQKPKILVRRMLEDIAKRLNKGEKIDWNDETQLKFFIHFDVQFDKIMSYHRYSKKEQGTVYSLSDKFLYVAIKEIGEERLEKYLKGE